jgi:hypothetical protein
MHKEIIEVDRERGLYRVTTVGERWYARQALEDLTGLPCFEFIPSITWICGSLPKSEGFWRWLAAHGWDQAVAIREAAADKGSKVHQACTDLIDGKTLAKESEYRHPTTGELAALTIEEWEAVWAFQRWWAQAWPTTLLRDAVLIGDAYAGTVDWVGRIGAEKIEGFDGDPRGLWLIDWKTSQRVYPEHAAQVSAYKALLLADTPASVSGAYIPGSLPFLRLGILQLGYRENKRGWKLTEIPDSLELFEAARVIWGREHADEKPAQRDYPLELTLAHGPAPAPKARRGRKASA